MFLRRQSTIVSETAGDFKRPHVFPHSFQGELRESFGPKVQPDHGNHGGPAPGFHGQRLHWPAVKSLYQSTVCLSKCNICLSIAYNMCTFTCVCMNIWRYTVFIYIYICSWSYTHVYIYIYTCYIYIYIYICYQFKYIHSKTKKVHINTYIYIYNVVCFRTFWISTGINISPKISNPQTPGPTGTGTHSLWKAAVPVLFVFAGRRLMVWLAIELNVVETLLVVE